MNIFRKFQTTKVQKTGLSRVQSESVAETLKVVKSGI